MSNTALTPIWIPDPEVERWRRYAMDAFSRLWLDGRMTEAQAHTWLSNQMSDDMKANPGISAFQHVVRKVKAYKP